MVLTVQDLPPEGSFSPGATWGAYMPFSPSPAAEESRSIAGQSTAPQQSCAGSQHCALSEVFG